MHFEIRREESEQRNKETQAHSKCEVQDYSKGNGPKEMRRIGAKGNKEDWEWSSGLFGHQRLGLCGISKESVGQFFVFLCVEGAE